MKKGEVGLDKNNANLSQRITMSEEQSSPLVEQICPLVEQIRALVNKKKVSSFQI